MEEISISADRQVLSKRNGRQNELDAPKKEITSYFSDSEVQFVAEELKCFVSKICIAVRVESDKVRNCCFRVFSIASPRTADHVK